MNKLVFASMEKSAGKTTVIVGLARAMKLDFGYLKPFGERLVYLKKRLWDYDSALMTGVFGLKETPEDMTIGFGQSKLRYMYDEETRKKKLDDMASKLGKGRDILLIEGGSGLRHGGSVGLDPVTVAKQLGAKLVVVTSGTEDTVLDDIHFLKKRIDISGATLGGIIINKMQNTQNFRVDSIPQIEKLGQKVLGVIPFEKELTHITVRLLSEKLFAKSITGDAGMEKLVKHIFVGSMSADGSHKNALSNIFNKEHKLIITSGDRSDMILTALESDTSCILLTNNLMPPANLITKAQDKGVPMLLVPYDTYSTASQVDDLEPLLTKDDNGKLALVEKLVRDNVDITELLRF